MSNERTFFAWQAGPRGPVPVVYHGSLPEKMAGKQEAPLAVHEIADSALTGTSSFFDVDGTPHFGALARAFPPPAGAGVWNRPPEPARIEPERPATDWAEADAAIERGEPVSAGPGGAAVKTKAPSWEEITNRLRDNAAVPKKPVIYDRTTAEDIERTCKMLGTDRLTAWYALTPMQKNDVLGFYNNHIPIDKIHPKAHKFVFGYKPDKPTAPPPFSGQTGLVPFIMGGLTGFTVWLGRTFNRV